jgi:hypothetical protein
MARKWNLTSVLRSALRRAWQFSPARKEALANARIGYGRYICAVCGAEQGPRDVAVDHIVSCTPPEGITSWDEYVARLFCGPEGLQILCKSLCHKLKTAEERKARKAKK